MKAQSYLIKETARIAAGVFILVAVMMACYAVMGAFGMPALLGGIYTGILAVGNFFVMGLTVQAIADRAAEENRTEEELELLTKHMKAKMQSSYTLRMLAMFGLIVVGIAVLKFDPLATILPIIFPRIAIAAIGIIGKVSSKGGAKG